MNRHMTQVSNDGKTWENVEGMPAETLMTARGATRQGMIEGLLIHFKATHIRVITPTTGESAVIWTWPSSV